MKYPDLQLKFCYPVLPHERDTDGKKNCHKIYLDNRGQSAKVWKSGLFNLNDYSVICEIY